MVLNTFIAADTLPKGTYATSSIHILSLTLPSRHTLHTLVTHRRSCNQPHILRYDYPHSLVTFHRQLGLFPPTHHMAFSTLLCYLLYLYLIPSPFILSLIILPRELTIIDPYTRRSCFYLLTHWAFGIHLDSNLLIVRHSAPSYAVLSNFLVSSSSFAMVSSSSSLISLISFDATYFSQHLFLFDSSPLFYTSISLFSINVLNYDIFNTKPVFFAKRH